MRLERAVRDVQGRARNDFGRQRFQVRIIQAELGNVMSEEEDGVGTFELLAEGHQSRVGRRNVDAELESFENFVLLLHDLSVSVGLTGKIDEVLH